MGTWPSDNIDSILLGKLGPAMRRMPDFDAATASALSAVWYIVHEILTDITVIVATWSAGSDLRSVYQVKPNRIKFHSALDSHGQTILNLENIVDSVDRYALHVSNIVVKITNVFHGVPGSEQVIPRIVDMQKVLVYSKVTREFRVSILKEILTLSLEYIDHLQVCNEDFP